MSRFGLELLMLTYSCVLVLLWPALKFLAVLNPNVARQARGRFAVRATALALAKARAQHRHCVVFFCSSAGEYEQARPMIDKLSLDGDTLVHVFFFSWSGIEFVTARNDKISHSPAPLDTVWHWGWLLSALRPAATIVVRHEWWPGFLWTAQQWGKLFLVDATAGRNKSRLKIALSSRLASFFDQIHVVANSDAKWFAQTLQVPQTKILVSGDTKFDRACERLLQRKDDVTALRQDFERIFPNRQKLVAGSVHRPDVEILIDFWSALNDEQKSASLLVLTPHDVSEDKAAELLGMIRTKGLRVVRMTQLGRESTAVSAEVLYVDRMGLLAELYGVADAAFIGGAMHHKVHNVLEGAAWGLPLACGPHYLNSHEAVILKREGILDVIQDRAQLTAWWAKARQLSLPERQKIAGQIASLGGASQRIMAALHPTVHNSEKTDPRGP
jgi:3-deoxy-D-manno-octulosonic-acid transferase